MDQQIAWQEQILAHVIRAGAQPQQTTFVTPDSYSMQVGFVVVPEGGAVQPHIHRPIERAIVGTSEFLLVRSGMCKVDIYNDRTELVDTVVLHPGDAILLVAGGHGFTMSEDTVLLEVKQGPYLGLDDKTRFDASGIDE